MKKTLIMAAMAAAALAVAAPASATVTFSFTPSVPSPTSGFVVVDNFNTTAGLTGAHYFLRTPPNTNTGVAPANAVPYGTSYLDVVAGGNATYKFAPGGVSAFEFDWGTIDTYNVLTVGFVGGGYQTITGAGLIAHGTTAESSGLFTFIDTTQKISLVNFSSGGNSFEVDDLSIAAVPEPGIWALMLGGFAIMGAALRRRRNVSAQAA